MFFAQVMGPVWQGSEAPPNNGVERTRIGWRTNHGLTQCSRLTFMEGWAAMCISLCLSVYCVGIIVSISRFVYFGERSLCKIDTYASRF